jgi:hypothetical protein
VNVEFPSPVEHALSLIETCGGLQMASYIAETNCEYATTDADSEYWFRVLVALTPAEDACHLH